MRSTEPSALKPRYYHVLLALANGARHGLAIAREVQESSSGQVRLWPATLYGTLDELLERGWIAELSEQPPEESDKKRFYQLTRAGRRVLAAETERLGTLVKAARARLKRAGETG
jgi:DNA-binding PadR family transcriptional regulator